MLNFVQVARLHPQKLTDRDVGAKCSDDDAENTDGARGDGKDFPSDDHHGLGLVVKERINAAAQDKAGQQCRQQPDGNGPADERATDKAPGGADELHGVDGKTAGKDTEFYRIGNKREGDESQENGQDK